LPAPLARPQSDSQAAWVKRQKEGPPPGSAPAAPGSKEVPDGEPNCLAGLKFVFTGELSSLSREEATELAKRYGGCVLPIRPALDCRLRLLDDVPADL
jgi:NAD-dependent DNA ligase